MNNLFEINVVGGANYVMHHSNYCSNGSNLSFFLVLFFSKSFYIPYISLLCIYNILFDLLYSPVYLRY